MPRRSVIIMILIFYCFSLGTLAYRDWLPYFLADDQAPPFEIDLTDEVSAQHVSWALYRNDVKIGDVFSIFNFDKNSELFYWTQTINDLKFQFEIINIKADIQISSWTTEMTLTPKGELLDFRSRVQMNLKAIGLDAGAVTLEMKGKIRDETLAGEAELNILNLKMMDHFGPTPIPNRSVFNSLQPIHRVSGLYPGRTWRVSTYDFLGESMQIVLKKMLDQMLRDTKQKLPFNMDFPKPTGSTTMIAKVLNQTEILEWNEQEVECYIIEYGGNDDLRTRTWVRVKNGDILMQEATGLGEKLSMVRLPERRR